MLKLVLLVLLVLAGLLMLRLSVARAVRRGRLPRAGPPQATRRSHRTSPRTSWRTGPARPFALAAALLLGVAALLAAWLVQGGAG